MERKVAFSCFIDDDEKFYKQLLFFVESLIHIGNVNPANIFIHAKNTDHKIIKYYISQGVNVIRSRGFGDYKYCNKLAQLDTDFSNFDAVIFCDSDLLFIQNIESWIYRLDFDYINVKTVDFACPPLSLLDQVREELGLPVIEKVNDTLKGEQTLLGNANGGFYFIPVKYLNELNAAWKNFASLMLANDRIYNSILGVAWNKHVDQISFCFAINELKLKINLIGIEFNFPYHVANKELVLKINQIPNIVHYHDKLDFKKWQLINVNPRFEEIMEFSNKLLRDIDIKSKYKSFFNRGIILKLFKFRF